MSELPAGWIAASLGEFTSEPSQRVPSASEEFLYIDISSVDRNTKRITSPQRLRGDKAPSRARKEVRTGDVLVSMTRPNLNAVAIVSQELNGQIASTGFDVLRPAGAEARWLFGVVRSTQFTRSMSELVQGALYPAVRSKDVRAYVARFPPVPEQSRIADKVDALIAKIDSCRERLDRVPQILKRFREEVLESAVSGRLTEEWRKDSPNAVEETATQWLSRISATRATSMSGGRRAKETITPDLTYWNRQLPSGWAVASVSQFAECLDYARVPVKRDDRKSALGLYPYYGANGLVDMVDDFIFDGELVLVTEDETFFGRKKPIAYRSSGKCWVNNHAHVLSLPNASMADYVCYSLMHYDVIPWLTGTTGRAKLTQGVLNSLPIAIPPPRELEEIVRRVRELLTYADSLQRKHEAAVARVDKLTPAVLAKAFRGELVPQDPNDEPANVLLQRIRAERATRADATGSRSATRRTRRAS